MECTRRSKEVPKQLWEDEEIRRRWKKEERRELRNNMRKHKVIVVIHEVKRIGDGEEMRHVLNQQDNSNMEETILHFYSME